MGGRGSRVEGRHGQPNMPARSPVHVDDVDHDDERPGAHVRHQTQEVTVVVGDHGWSEDGRRVRRLRQYQSERAGEQDPSSWTSFGHGIARFTASTHEA